MRHPTWLAFLALTLPAFAQNGAPSTEQSLPKDPRGILEAAAPLYDYNSADMKPFHLSAKYQMYDVHGNPGETGTFDYWYVSGAVHRSTWVRPGVEYTVWQTANGKSSHAVRAGNLQFFETKLEKAWVAPLPNLKDMGASKAEPERQELELKGGAKLECVELVPEMPQRARDRFVGIGWFPTYCFDEHLPALRVEYSFGGLVTEFYQLVKFRDKYLPKRIVMQENGRPLLKAELVTITSLAADDAALTPVADAVSSAEALNLPMQSAAGKQVKKVAPIYPAGAKSGSISGTVVLQAVIGKDGRIHECQVVSAPSPSLAAAALAAVAQWEYKPYVLKDGQAVEVNTTVNVIYSLLE